MEGKIFEAIPKIMSEVGAVGKDSVNKQQGFKFRGIDAVMNALHPALARNKVFVVPEVLQQTREERTTAKGANLIYSICKIRYTFYAEDGSYVSSVVIGEGMDSGDKATNKALAIALKYAFFQVFCIPTEEMIDPDSEVHEVVSKKDQAAAKQIGQNLDKKITDKELAILQNTLTDNQAAWVLDKFKIADLSELTAGQYASIFQTLNQRKNDGK